MRYRVQGADEATGADRELRIDAASAADAENRARAQGLLVSSVSIAGQHPAEDAAAALLGVQGSAAPPSIRDSLTSVSPPAHDPVSKSADASANAGHLDRTKVILLAGIFSLLLWQQVRNLHHWVLVQQYYGYAPEGITGLESQYKRLYESKDRELSSRIVDSDKRLDAIFADPQIKDVLQRQGKAESVRRKIMAMGHQPPPE